MKSTIAITKQLFNVKALATAGLLPEAIPNDTVGIVDTSTGLTVTSALPAEFTIIGKVNGKPYFSISDIKKSEIKKAYKQDRRVAEPEGWVTTLESCGCMGPVTLTIGIDETSLRLRDGMTWTHRDFVVEVPTAEMACHCSCDGVHKVYENNVMTMLLHNAIQKKNSPFYTSAVIISTDGLPTGAAYPPTPAEGDVFIKTGTTPGVQIYKNGDWVLLATTTGVVTDVEGFVEFFKGVNTDSSTTNEGPMLSLAITGKNLPTPNYNDLELNYIYPRGARLSPAITIGKGNNTTTVAFTKTNSLVYEMGAGYDLRREEFESMNFYTNLNYHNRICGGFQSPDLVYQFENQKSYDEVGFEYHSETTLANDGETRLTGVVLATTEASVYTTLKTLFGV